MQRKDGRSSDERIIEKNLAILHGDEPLFVRQKRIRCRGYIIKGNRRCSMAVTPEELEAAHGLHLCGLHRNQGEHKRYYTWDATDGEAETELAKVVAARKKRLDPGPLYTE